MPARKRHESLADRIVSYLRNAKFLGASTRTTAEHHVGSIEDKKTLQIGLSAWIIQDGNYADFVCDSILRFAIEFYSEDGLSILAREAGDAVNTCLIQRHDCQYQATGLVRFCAEDVWVVEFDGVLAFREESPPNGIVPGAIVSGDIWLGVDPFFYFERLFKTPNIPPLIYEWQIESIAMETAPFIETADSFGRKFMVRDQSQHRRVPIASTDAWKDDNGNADYLLTCRRTGVLPSKELSL